MKTLRLRSTAPAAALLLAMVWMGVRVALEAQSGASAARPVPRFEVERGWPPLPATMQVGDASSFAVDTKDRVWLLHRPRTITPEAGKTPAPPVVVFDAAGTVVKTWGGDGAG